MNLICKLFQPTMRGLLQAVILPVLIACGGGGSGGGDDGGCTSGIPSATTNETTYCGTAKSISGSTVTVTGTANYQYRELSSDGLTNTISTRPIRFAEIRVTDSSGTLVQCGETDANGNISVAVPADGGNYTVSVTSRANNSQSKVSVLDAPDTNQFYSISGTVAASGSPTVTLVAKAKGDLKGGAFNIYDQIVTTNQYLKTQLASCSTVSGPSVACTPFTSGSFVPSGKTGKVQAYWKAGFNPNSYFCSDSSGLSFYTPDTDQLFILGGIDGDTDNSDTDHFDNSVIIHEYGHFLEDQYSTSDSPGGSHDGSSILDPRLVWSEGWANFIQNAVLQDADPSRTPAYQDTSGNADGETLNFFLVSLEFRCDNGTSNEGNSNQCVDMPSTVGEGNFREFSVTRVLWDMIDTDEDDFDSPATYTDTLAMPFSEVWTSFINLRGSSLSFRSIGNFHEISNSLTGRSTSSTDYNNLVNSAFQQPNRTDYANPMDLGGSCTTTISQSGGNLFAAHDYFDVDHDGGVFALDLSYTGVNSASDIDLYLYEEDYVQFSSSSLVAASNAEDDGGSESLSVTNLAAGRYLIDVHYFAGGNNQTYTLKLKNGQKVCPDTSL